MKVKKPSRKKIVLVVLAIFGIMILLLNGLLVVALLFFLGVISHAYRRWVKGWPFGNELVTIGTVLVALRHGPVAGVTFGFITALVMQYVAFDLDFGAALQITGNVLTGLIVPFIPLPPIFLVGFFQFFVAFAAQTPGLLGDFESKSQSILVVITKVLFALVMWNVLYRYLFPFV